MLTKNPRLPGEARLLFLDNDFDIVEPGDYVLCATTGKKVPLDELRYWSMDLQEAYVDAKACSERMTPPYGEEADAS